jgi:hypothetical protein
MKMPRLDHAVEHQRMAPLTKAFCKKTIRRPDDLPEEATLVAMGHEIFKENAAYHLNLLDIAETAIFSGLLKGLQTSGGRHKHTLPGD